MRLLFTAATRSGAFVMRGEQIAAERPDWRATLTPSEADVAAADALVVVKDASSRILAAARAAGRPVIFDALDFWPQVKARWLPPSRAQRLTGPERLPAVLGPAFARIAPDLVLCVTRRMASDVAALGWPSAYVPHHADPRLPDAAAWRAADAAPRPRRLLYFGKRAFLGDWTPRIEASCRAAGAEFLAVDVGHGRLAAPPPADAMVAVRGGRDGGWLARAWKSNVKAATAARLGLPLVAWPEEAVRDTAPEAYLFHDDATLAAAVAAALGPGARAPTFAPTPADSAALIEAAAARLLRPAAGPITPRRERGADDGEA